MAFSSRICTFTFLFEPTILKFVLNGKKNLVFGRKKFVKRRQTFFDFSLFLSFDIAWNEVTKWVRIQKNHLTMLNSWKSLCICEIPKKLFNHCQPGVLKTRNPRIKLQDAGSKWRKRVRSSSKKLKYLTTFSFCIFSFWWNYTKYLCHSSLVDYLAQVKNWKN